LASSAISGWLATSSSWPTALLDGKLAMIEGSIRIKVLLDKLLWFAAARIWDFLPVSLKRIYDANCHIRTHQGWKDLPKAEAPLHEQQMPGR